MHARKPATEAAPCEKGTLKPHSADIVFVCLVYYPDSSASSLLFTDLFTRMAASGHRVTVLCGFPTKGMAGQFDNIPRRETVSGVTVERCGLRMLGKRNIVMRAAVYSSFLVHANWKLMRGFRGARVLGGTDPPFTAVALYLLSPVRRLRYDLILLDIYPDGLVALGKLNDSSLLTRAWRTLNRLSYACADNLIVIGRDMVSLLNARYRVPLNRPTYIPLWASAEVDTVLSSDPRSLLRELHLDDKFVVQYSGNMGLWHDMDTLVLAANLLRDECHIHFLFIGTGMRRQAAQSLATEYGLTNITWLDLLPRERLSESLTSCDAALISFRSGLEGVAVPSKLYGILASGTPVIAQVPEQSEAALVVHEEHCGIVVRPGDAAALADAIMSLSRDTDLVAGMKARAREAYRRKYTLGHAAQAFAALWDESAS